MYTCANAKTRIYIVDPGASSGSGFFRVEDSDSDDEEEPPVIYVQPLAGTEPRRNRIPRNSARARHTGVSASGINFSNGGLDFIPLDSSDSSDSDDSGIELEITFNDGPIEHFAPHQAHHSSGEDDDEQDNNLDESLILAYGAVPPLSGPGPIMSDIDDIGLQYARLNFDREREREAMGKGEVLISVTRLPPPGHGISSATRHNSARQRTKRSRGRPSARVTGGTSAGGARSRSRARLAATRVMTDIDEDSEEQEGMDHEAEETAHERFERRRREKAASAALNTERRRKKKTTRKRRQGWSRLYAQRLRQRQPSEGEGEVDELEEDGVEDEVRTFREEVLRDPYVRMMLASDSSSSDYDGVASLSSDDSYDRAEGPSRRGRDRSRMRKRARPAGSNTGSGASSNVPLSRQRRFRADDPIPLDGSARPVDDEENDDLYVQEPGTSTSNPALAGRSVIPYTASVRDKLLAFDKSRKSLNVNGTSASSSLPGQTGHDFASLAAREIGMWRRTGRPGQTGDDGIGDGDSMDLDMDARTDFNSLSSWGIDTTSSISTTGTNRTPLFFPTPTPGLESVASSSFRSSITPRLPLFVPTPTPAPESVASSSFSPFIPPTLAPPAPRKKRTPTPEPKMPLAQRIAMEIMAHGVPDPDEDDDLPDFEDDNEEDAGEEVGEVEMATVEVKEERVKKEEEETRAREWNDEIRRMKEQEWEMLRYVCHSVTMPRIICGATVLLMIYHLTLGNARQEREKIRTKVCVMNHGIMRSDWLSFFTPIH